MPAYNTSKPIAIGPGDSTYLFGVPNSAAVIAATPAGIVRNAGVVTVTTSAAHNFIPGNQVDIRGAGSVGNFQVPYGFDGQFQILTVPSTTTFTYLDPQKPDDTGGGGLAASIAAEAIVVSESGLAVFIRNDRGTTTPPSITWEIQFTGAPGAFEVDLQESDTDVDQNYIMNTVTTATKVTALATDLNAVNIARVDLSPIGGRFMRPKVIAFANFATINLLVKVTNLG